MEYHTLNIKELSYNPWYNSKWGLAIPEIFGIWAGSSTTKYWHFLYHHCKLNWGWILPSRILWFWWSSSYHWSDQFILQRISKGYSRWFLLYFNPCLVTQSRGYEDPQQLILFSFCCSFQSCGTQPYSWTLSHTFHSTSTCPPLLRIVLDIESDTFRWEQEALILLLSQYFQCSGSRKPEIWLNSEWNIELWPLDRLTLLENVVRFLQEVKHYISWKHCMVDYGQEWSPLCST